MLLQSIRHATLLLNYHGKRILVDPIFSVQGTMTPIEGVPNQNGNPLVALPISLESLLTVDAVLLTHTHRDHFDDEAAKLLDKSLPVFVQPPDEQKLRDKGFTNVIPVADSATFEGITINRTGGKHGHGVIARKMAPVSGYVLRAPGDPTLYIAGDTVYCRAVRLALSAFSPNIVVCNCGAAQFKMGLPITMGTRDIRRVCGRVPSAQIVAVHMEAWNHCRLTREDLRAFVSQFSLPVRIPNDGDSLEF